MRLSTSLRRVFAPFALAALAVPTVQAADITPAGMAYMQGIDDYMVSEGQPSFFNEYHRRNADPAQRAAGSQCVAEQVKVAEPNYAPFGHDKVVTVAAVACAEAKMLKEVWLVLPSIAAIRHHCNRMNRRFVAC